jgi:high-affinity iron transporter
MRSFFNVTGVLLMFFAAGLVANGLGEFGEAGVIPPIVAHVWDTSWLISGSSSLGSLLYTLFGYNAAPSLIQVVGYVGYWMLALLWIYVDQTAVVFRRVLATIRPE